MDKDRKTYKQTLRNFMRENYTDERLTWLLAHARSGRLAYYSCCCFIGIPTADHALRGQDWGWMEIAHYGTAELLPDARLAESHYCWLGNTDEQRARRLIPIVKAELRRRERERIVNPACAQLENALDARG